jgi:hypothetical protein
MTYLIVGPQDARPLAPARSRARHAERHAIRRRADGVDLAVAAVIGPNSSVITNAA